ncbi:MAG: hypothetical protein A2Z29_06515 [Chloroflexi bacterium RBG_16_56_11]|nr:MAG: hypothetical protein A2Z29_06515 [Chloroflexi bacterium RBG_16_56_11]
MTFRDEEYPRFNVESLFVIVPVIFTIAFYGIAWWREKIGGWLLVAAYMLLSMSPTLHTLVYDKSFHVYLGMWLFASPYLISGVLFLVAARFSPEYNP